MGPGRRQLGVDGRREAKEMEENRRRKRRKKQRKTGEENRLHT
jgi:hypothetical protein